MPDDDDDGESWMRQTAWLVLGVVTAGLLAAIPIGLLTAVPARAQVETREGIYLQNQILALQQQLNSLGGGRALPPPVPSGGGGVSAAQGNLVADLLARVQSLEEQVRELRGQIEDMRNTQTTTVQDLTKQIGDLSFQLQTLQGGGRSPAPALGGPPPLAGGPPMIGPPPLAPPPPAAVPPPPSRSPPEVVLQDGYAALARHDYKAAEAAARQVRTQLGPRNANANYLLAQAMAGQRNWPAAAVAYNDAYEAGHSATHAQDSLLGLANSLVALGDNRAACDALTKLNHEFPRQREDLRQSIAATRGHAGCR
jgi:TolA-binding protein